MDSASGLELLNEAAHQNGLSTKNINLIRNGSHLMCVLPGGVVGRVGESGTEATARREITVSRWLGSCGLRAVRALDGLVQPTVVRGHPVTWWELLPPHRPASTAELGKVLRRLHDLPVPTNLDLPQFTPLRGVGQRLARTRTLDQAERAWMQERIVELGHRYDEAVPDMPVGLIHGDAWQGNVAVPESGDLILLDLEAACIGPSYWDLIPIAVDHTDFARISAVEYEQFVASYGFDVIAAPGYRTLADIQELRWISFVMGKAEHDPAAAREAAHRISCMRGEVSRPWAWAAF